MRPAESVILIKSQHYWSEQHRQGFLGSGGRLRGSAGCGVRSGQEGSVLPTAGKLESAGGRTSCYPTSGHLEPASTACGLHHPLCANPGSAGVRRVRPWPPPSTTDWTDYDFAKNHHWLRDHFEHSLKTGRNQTTQDGLFTARLDMRACRRVGTNWL